MYGALSRFPASLASDNQSAAAPAASEAKFGDQPQADTPQGEYLVNDELHDALATEIDAAPGTAPQASANAQTCTGENSGDAAAPQQAPCEPKTPEEIRAEVIARLKAKALKYRTIPMSDTSVEEAVASITESVPGGDFDYVIGSPDDHFEGIFVRGDVNLVAGYSGSGKSTLLIKWLDEQQKRVPILGRPTFGLPYIVCLEDRSKRSFRRTLRRLCISEADIPVRRIDPKLPLAQWLETTLRTEKVMPAIAFVEGLDLATAKHKDMDEVSTICRQLGEIAEYYHIAIIGSVGCPKLKKNEDYDSLRSKVIGSTAWGRKAETIILLSREKDTDAITTMYVLYRHRAVEVIALQFEDGHFVVAPPEASASLGKTDNEDLLIAWSRTKTAGFTRADVQVFLKLGRTASSYLLDRLESRELLHVSRVRHGTKIYKPVCATAAILNPE